MTVAVLADERLKKEVEAKGLPPEVAVAWPSEFSKLMDTQADIYMDLLFEKSCERISGLQALLPRPVIINAVTETLDGIHPSFIRINAWPGFLQRPLTELCIANDSQEMKEIASAVFTRLSWPYQLVPDTPGMIAPRVIAMIINEAFFALGEGVSTKVAIDMAMKLGTNYPYGPFEWGERIGLKNIAHLLSVLSSSNERYAVSETLLKEVLTGDTSGEI